ncbi:MAG: hypothetical protein AAFO94_06505, partial [Bacteroidota bacterium]
LIADSSQEEWISALGSILLQSKVDFGNGQLKADLVQQFTRHAAPENQFPIIVMRLLSLPEYQLC